MADEPLTPEEEAQYQQLLQQKQAAGISDAPLSPQEEAKYQQLQAAAPKSRKSNSTMGLAALNPETPAPQASPQQAAQTAGLLAPDSSAVPSGESGVPDITSAVSSALMPPEAQHLPYDPIGVVDKYKDMGDFMRMPSLWKDFSKSPMAALGMIGSDADSFEKIIQKNYKKIKIRHDEDGNLLMTDPEDKTKEYLFRRNSFQQGDAIRALMGAGLGIGGSLIGAGAGALAMAAAPEALLTAAASAPAWLSGTGTAMLNQYALSKLRSMAGGAPVSPWEILGAAGLHMGFGRAHQWWRGPEPGVQTAEQLSKNAVAGARGSSAAVDSTLGQMQPKRVVVDAADRLGVGDSLTPGQASGNPVFKQMTQTVLGDGADRTHTDTLRQVSDAFERGIKEGNGPGSQDAMEAIRKNITQNLEESRQGVANAYKPETIGVPKEAPTPVNNLLAKVDAKIAAYKGAEVPKDLLKIRARLTTAEGSAPEWQVVDDLMKDLGASSKGKAPYKSLQASGVLGDFIEAGKADQQLAADAISPGAGERFTVAKEAFKAHNALKTLYRQVMTNAAADSLAGKVVPAIGLLGNGVPEAFEKVMTLTPKKDRAFVALAGMYQFVKELTDGNTLMDARKYVNFMDGLERNPLSRKALEVHLPDAFRQIMKDTYVVTKAILETSRIPAGAFEHEFKDSIPLKERLKMGASSAAKFITMGAVNLPQAFGFDVAGELFGKPDPLQPLVRKILTSPLSKEVMRRQAAGAPISEGLFHNFVQSAPVQQFTSLAPQLKNAPLAQRMLYWRNALGNTKFLEGQQQQEAQ